MNILHLSAVKNWGGGENHIENLCLELRQIAPEVNNIIFCNKEGEFKKKLEAGDLKVYPARLRFKMDPLFFISLIRICKKKKIDLIHIHDTTALTLAVFGDLLYDLPPFIFSKKTSFPIKPRIQTLYKYNYPKIKSILCVSKATENVTRRSIKGDQKIINIYHGMNINGIKTSPYLELKEKLKLPPDTILIGNIANHIRAKNLETFIAVANELIHIRGIKNIHFIQIGAYSNRTKNLKQEVKEFDLEAHISFLGEIPQAANLIPQFDISLMTSQSEGLPQFIYESFYHQTPVVCTDVGGISEIIEHNKTGLLAPAHDFLALANHLETLINYPDKRKLLIQTTRELIENNFTTEIMARKTLEVYKDVIQNGRFKTGN